MLPINDTVQNILDASSKKFSWLWDVEQGSVTYNWSTKNYTFNLTSYENRIVPTSFTGIELNSSLANYGVMAPSIVEFDISDTEYEFSANDFIDEEITIKLVMSDYTNEEIIASWKFYVINASREEGIIHISCKDFFSRYLKGTYPNTERVSSLSPSDDAIPNDTLCVPLIFGTAYIPIRSLYISDARYYIIGPDSPTYTISEFRTPIDWDSVSTYNNSYTYTQATKTLNGTDYKVVSPITVDSDNDDVPDSTALFYKSGRFLDAQLKLSRNDTVSITSPEEVLEYVLEDMGVPSSNLDTNVNNETVFEDDCADDGTGDWFVANSGALAFDTDHYEFSTDGGAGYCANYVSLVKGKKYRIAVDIKDGTETGATVFLRYYNASDSANGSSFLTTGTFTEHELYFEAQVTGTYNIQVRTEQDWSGNNIEFKNFIIGETSSFLYHGNVTFPDWGLEFNGGFYSIQDRMEILASVLTQCNSTLRVTDKVELHVLSKTSVKSISSAHIRSKSEEGTTTYSYRENEKDDFDSAYVVFPEANAPQMLMKQKLIPVDTSTDYIANETIETPFITDPQDSQRAGILNIQKKYGIDNIINFEGRDDLVVLQPDEVITITGQKYNGDHSAFINQIRINYDLTISIEAYEFAHSLEDWGDVSTDAVTIETDDSVYVYTSVMAGPDDPNGINKMISRMWISNTILLDGVSGKIVVGTGTNIITIDSTFPAIKMGYATDYLTGEGIFEGLSGGLWKVHIGDPANDHLYYDGAGNLHITGIFTGSTALDGTEANTWTVNSDLTDTTSAIILGRTTGGNLTLDWNGTVGSIDKNFRVNSMFGVGVSPSYLLHVQGSTANSNVMSIGSTSNRPLIISDYIAQTLDNTGVEFKKSSSLGEFLFSNTNLSSLLHIGYQGNLTIANDLYVNGGNISTASGTLTLGIGGTPEVSITSTETIFGGNLVIPNSGYIGSASDTDAMQIEADGDVVFNQRIGIGGNPTVPLYVYHPIINGLATFESGDSTVTIQIKDSNTTGAGYAFVRSGDALSLCTTDTERLIIADNGNVSLTNDLYVNGGNISTASGDLTLSPGDELIIDPTGNAMIINASVDISTNNFVSQSTGWNINYDGSADFRNLYADELFVKAFTAEVYSALAGGLIITKSRAELTRDFTIPNTSGTATLYVSDLEGLPDTAVFVAGDYIRLRVIDRSGGGLIVTDVYGTVSSYTNLSGGEQSWIFTTTTAGYSSADVIYAGSVALDYGQTGSGSTGVWEVTVLDPSGSPYSQVQTWSGVSGGEPSTFTTWTRIGNLDGLSGIGEEFGIYAGQGLTDSDPYVLITDQQVDLHNIPITIHDGVAERIKLDPSGPTFALGASTPSAFLTGDGIWMGNDSGTYKFRVGDVNGEVFYWDGSTFYLGVVASEHIRADGSTVAFYNNTTKMAELSGTSWTLGNTSDSYITLTDTTLTMFAADGTDQLLIQADYLRIGDPTTFNYLNIDSINGLRMYAGTASSTLYAQLTNAGILYLGNQSAEHVKVSSSGTQIYDGATLYATYGATTTIGLTASEHISISSTSVQFKDGATVYTDLTAGVLTLGDTSNEHALINTSGLTIKDGATVLANYGATTTIGQVASGKGNLYIDSSGNIAGRVNTTERWRINTDNSGWLGTSGNGISWSTSGEIVIGGFTHISGYLYSLTSGTPTSSPVGGIVIKGGTSGGYKVYDSSGVLRVDLGYIA